MIAQDLQNNSEFTLFDFEINKVPISEEEITEAFQLLVQRVKAKGNYYGFNGVFLNDVKKYFYVFEERGWIKKGQIRSDLIDYHTVEEIMEQCEEHIERLLQQPHDTINFSEDTWRTFSKFMPCRFHKDEQVSQSIRRKLYKMQKPLLKRVAITLGLKHYLDCEKSRGSVMNAFSHKAYEKYLIPYLTSQIININDFDKMKDLFDNYFLVGRRDMFMDRSSVKVTPYAQYERVNLNDLQIAALCEANEKNAHEVLKLVLKHAGKSTASRDTLLKNDNYSVVYTTNYTHTDYINSLTADDCTLIFDDVMRLKRLHSKSNRS